MHEPPPILYRARFALLALACLIELAFIGYWMFLGLQDAVSLVFGGVLLAIQGAFLFTTLSLRRWPGRMVQSGRPIMRVVIVAGFMASFLLVGLVWTMLEWPGWWWDESLQSLFNPGSVLGTLFVGWIVWSIVFYFYWRRHDRYIGLTRITRALLAGSALETFIAAPTMALVRDPENCVCARGSFWGLIFGISGIVCVFGPGVVMIFLRQRYIAQRLVPTCPECSYNLTGCAGSACPECGWPIPQPLRERIATHSAQRVVEQTFE